VRFRNDVETVETYIRAAGLKWNIINNIRVPADF
jgi:hypothetical protein